jgi:hypothetical protein
MQYSRSRVFILALVVTLLLTAAAYASGFVSLAWLYAHGQPSVQLSARLNAHSADESLVFELWCPGQSHQHYVGTIMHTDNTLKLLELDGTPLVKDEHQASSQMHYIATNYKRAIEAWETYLKSEQLQSLAVGDTKKVSQELCPTR